MFCRENRYRCPLLNESRTTTAARTTSNIGACPVVPPSLCGYQQGEPTPSLVSRLLRRARLSHSRESFGHEQVPGRPHTGGIHLTCRSAKIPCTGTVGSPNSLPLRTLVGSGSNQQVKPRGVTLDGTIEMVRKRHQRNELKRNILVSPRWCLDTSGMN